MLSYNEITAKKYIILDGEPYEVLSSAIAKKQRQKPVNRTKVKNLITGKVAERAFHQSDAVDEADIDTKPIQYLYNTSRLPAGRQGEFWFCEKDDPRERFAIDEALIGGSGKFLKEKNIVDALFFDEKIIGIRLPVKVNLRVVEAPPAVRGNTAQGATKQVVLETGASVAVPLFINEGDIVRINTETARYAERVEKG